MNSDLLSAVVARFRPVHLGAQTHFGGTVYTPVMKRLLRGRTEASHRAFTRAFTTLDPKTYNSARGHTAAFALFLRDDLEPIAVLSLPLSTPQAHGPPSQSRMSVTLGLSMADAMYHPEDALREQADFVRGACLWWAHDVMGIPIDEMHQDLRHALNLPVLIESLLGQRFLRDMGAMHPQGHLRRELDLETYGWPRFRLESKADSVGRVHWRIHRDDDMVNSRLWNDLVPVPPLAVSTQSALDVALKAGLMLHDEAQDAFLDRVAIWGETTADDSMFRLLGLPAPWILPEEAFIEWAHASGLQISGPRM